MYQGNNRISRNSSYIKRPSRKPRNRLERIEVLQREASNLAYRLTKKFSSNGEMFELLVKLETVQKNIEIQQAYNQYEVQNEELKKVS